MTRESQTEEEEEEEEAAGFGLREESPEIFFKDGLSVITEKYSQYNNRKLIRLTIIDFKIIVIIG